MKKSKLFSISLLTISLIVSSSIFAYGGMHHRGNSQNHRGRNYNYNTNSNLHCNENAHYYCGGNPQHLHNQGICPYNSSNTSANTHIPHTNMTDIKAYIDDTYIRSYNCNNSTYIVAEDLREYGCDVVWNENSRTLNITKQANREITGIASELADVQYQLATSDIKTQLYNSSTKAYDTIDSYNIGGKTIIKLSDFCDTAKWDNTNRTIHASHH